MIFSFVPAQDNTLFSETANNVDNTHNILAQVDISDILSDGKLLSFWSYLVCFSLTFNFFYIPCLFRSCVCS
jgi:hypothetical protein